MKDSCVSKQQVVHLYRWPPDPGPQAREIQAHALALQALLMLRESQAGCCWDIPVCKPASADQADGAVAGTSQSGQTGQNGAAVQHPEAEVTTGPVLSAVLDELQAVQNLTVCSAMNESLLNIQCVLLQQGSQ